MELSNPSFWIDRLLLLATTYVIIAYAFGPSSNKCQMTFMMEPPTFVPVPIDHEQNNKNTGTSKSPSDSSSFNKYKLYMYSEIGFPQLSNVQRDFRDSMPVLFIPGNAGSYQQVRSLASTCIRHQLQSLDSYKFIFYTIDFNEELSGISGRLIQEETRFVHEALKQIGKLHPEETGGIIVIGHSVGGFISKNLFTLPDFDADSVPLVISLASPLNKPHLTFDDEMAASYKAANLIWEQEVANRNNTISISISGGISDKLVPMHLSMDPTYDLSLTTSAIRGVWLDTDHVCITWCRELMHKLSNLLSSLMDKKHTHLINNKSEALDIIKNQLLTHDKPLALRNPNVIFTREWKSSKSHRIVDFSTYKQLTRLELSNHVVVLRTDKLLGTDLLIIIDHINEITSGKVFKCLNLQTASDEIQLRCSRRVDLIDFGYQLPTRISEPKRTAIKIDLGKQESDETIVFDFCTHLDRSFELSSRLPELISIQEVHTEHEETLYIPTLLELVVRKVLFMESYSYNVEGLTRESTIMTRYRLLNLIHGSQIITMELESQDCKDGYPNHSAIMLYRGEYLSQSFNPRETPPKDRQDNKKISFKFNLRMEPLVIMKNNLSNDDERYYLDFLIDGTCKNNLILDPDFAAIAILCLHRNLARILALNSYIILVSIIDKTLSLFEATTIKQRSSSTATILKILGFLIVYFLHEYNSPEIDRPLADQTTFFLAISVLSYGIVALLRHIFHRLVNITTILYNCQSFIRRRLLATKPLTKDSNNLVNGNSNSTSCFLNEKTDQRKLTFSRIDWILISLSVVGSIIFSVALTSMTQLLFVIRTKFNMSSSSESFNQDNKHLSKNTQQKETHSSNKSNNSKAQELVADLAVFCSLGMVANIPEALLRIKTSEIYLMNGLFGSSYRRLPFVLSNISLILVKTICVRLISTKPSTNLKLRNPSGSFLGIRNLIPLVGKFGYLLILVPILQIESNQAHIRMALTLTLVWLYMRLLSVDIHSKWATNGRKDQ